MSLYLKLLLISLSIPFIFSFHPRIRFYKSFSSAFLSITITSLFFILWDIYFTDIKVWGFTEIHHGDGLIMNLPIEEVLFFFVIPFCCMFTYFTFKKFDVLKMNRNVKLFRFLAVLLIILSIIYYENAYTLSVFIYSSIILFYISSVDKKWFGYFFGTYLLISLIPFIIVNGILTGIITQEPPVWYNPQEIIGIKCFTIPIEDFFYCFCLLFTNFLLFEIFEKRFERKSQSNY